MWIRSQLESSQILIQHWASLLGVTAVPYASGRGEDLTQKEMEFAPGRLLSGKNETWFQTQEYKAKIGK